MAFTPQAQTVVQAFGYETPMAFLAYGKMLGRNEARSANFFTRHGMVTKTLMDRSVQTPIQQVEDFEGGRRIDTMRTFIADILRGTPQVSADEPAPTDRRTIPQTEFEFKTIDMYGPVLDIPDSHREFSMTISIHGNYATQLREWWQAVVENLIWIYLTGMRGQGDNWRAIDAVQETHATNVSTSNTDTFTNFMKKVHAINPITKPEKQMATWHNPVVKLGQTLSANTATVAAANNITFSLCNALSTWLETRSVERMGIGFDKALIKNLPKGPSNEHAWVIAPEVGRRIRDQFSNQSGSAAAVEWGNFQQAKAEGGAKPSAFETGWIGSVYGLKFVTADALPRYLGGASNTVPIARTLILGRSALVFGFRTQEMKNSLLARFHHRGKALGKYGAPYHCWITDVNEGRKSALQSKCDFGVKKVTYKNFDTANTEVDKGVLAIDVPYDSLETSGI